MFLNIQGWEKLKRIRKTVKLKLKNMVEKCLYLRCAPDSLVVFTWLVFGLEHTFMSTYYYAQILKSTI